MFVRKEICLLIYNIKIETTFTSSVKACDAAGGKEVHIHSMSRVLYVFSHVIYTTEPETANYHFHLTDKYIKAQTGQTTHLS